MSNYNCHQNGSIKVTIIQKESSRNCKSFKKFHLRELFRWHICFLSFFHIISTLLMIISLGYTFEGISAEEIFDDRFSDEHAMYSEYQNSFTMGNDSFDDIIYRFPRVSERKSSILSKFNLDKVCKLGNYADRFKSLNSIRLNYCNMFEVPTVIYQFLFNLSDLISLGSNISFPTFQSSETVFDKTISKLPSQLLILTHTGDILASSKSTQNLISTKFSSTSDCRELLERIIEIDNIIQESVMTFRDTVLKSQCDVSKKPVRLKSAINCDYCETAYKNWLCTQNFDMFTSITLPNSEISNSQVSHSNQNVQSAIVGIKSCSAWCSKVERDCVYFTPTDGNGGEPAFLCDESHYHHNARYRLNTKAECGAELPWKFCCFSQPLLDKLQNDMVIHDPQNCSRSQHRCLTKIVKTLYQTGVKLTPSFSNQSETRRSSSFLSCQRNLIYVTCSFFLYFYSDLFGR